MFSINRVKYFLNVGAVFAISLLSLYSANEAKIMAFGNTEDQFEMSKYINNESDKITQVKINLLDDAKVTISLPDSLLKDNYNKIDANVTVHSIDENDISVKDIVSSIDRAKQEKLEEQTAEQRSKEISELGYSTIVSQGGLLDIQSPDPNYTTNVVNISGADRDILERLVMGEAGNQGFEGAALVAQCIKDMYILGNYDSVESVRTSCGYSGSLKIEPNEDVLKAVEYVFDNGGYAVKHRILYFYSPSNMESGYSGFHESQNNIINYGGHKFFDRW